MAARTGIVPRTEAPLGDRVYQRLRWALIVGDYRPGNALSIRTLAKLQGTSTMPIRESLKRLASERALISSMNRSFRVPSLDPKRVSDLFFVRASLEGIATELATPRLTTDQIDQLDDLARRTDRAVDTGDRRDYLARNYSFHFTIYAGAGNDELTSIIEGLWAQTGPYLAEVVNSLGMTEDWRAHHGAIARAIRVRDVGLARRLVEQDIGWGTRLFEEIASHDRGATREQS